MNPTLAATVPRQVLLFSGHMIDAPDRKTPRFPAAQEGVARDAIAALLARLQSGPQDLAVCSAACGGDILFAEICVQRDVPLAVYLPFDAATFAKESVDFAGGDWHARFDAVCAAATVHLMPDERPAVAAGEDPYEQNNLWMLESANAHGPAKVDFICLWNGQGGDGPGGTQHLMQEVTQRQGRVHRLDTTQLW